MYETPFEIKGAKLCFANVPRAVIQKDELLRINIIMHASELELFTPSRHGSKTSISAQHYSCGISSS